MATIGQMAKAGWTCKRLNASGSGCWCLTNQMGVEVVVDMGEQRKWIVAIDGGRNGWDTVTFGDALQSVIDHYPL